MGWRGVVPRFRPLGEGYSGPTTIWVGIHRGTDDDREGDGFEIRHIIYGEQIFRVLRFDIK